MLSIFKIAVNVNAVMLILMCFCFSPIQRGSTRLKLLLQKREKPYSRNLNLHPSL